MLRDQLYSDRMVRVAVVLHAQKKRLLILLFVAVLVTLTVGSVGQAAEQGSVTLNVSAPANGTHFAVGEKPVVSVTLPPGTSKDDFSRLNLYLYGPQETNKTVAAVKLLNASADRSARPHHYIDLLTNPDVNVNGNVLTYNLQAVSDEEAGTYTASLNSVSSDDPLDQAMILDDFQIGTGTVETQIVDKDKCAQCHLGADNGQFYFHHVDPSSPGSVGSPSLESWPVRTCKSCHNTDGYAAYRDPADSSLRVPDPIVFRVHGIHMGEELENPRDIDPVTGIFRDYIDVVFPYGVRGKNIGSTWTEIPGVKNCTVCHADDRWKTKPSRLACGSCHDNIWFGDLASMPATAEMHPGGSQSSDAGCAFCHPADKGGVKAVAAAHKVDPDPTNVIDVSMTPPLNGKYYDAADDATGVTVTVTIKDDSGTAIIDHTKVDDTGNNFSSANLFVYGPSENTKPVMTNVLTKITKLRASVTNTIDGPWAGLNGKTFKVAIDGGIALDIPITGSEPLTQAEMIASLNAVLASENAMASASSKRVKIESLTQGGEDSKIAIYKGDVTTAMGWKPTGVTMEPYVVVGRASYPNNDLRNLTKVDPLVDYIDPDVTRNAGNITYTLRGKFADLTPGTYFVLVYCVPARNTTTNASKVAGFEKNSGLGFMTFQVGTETEDKKIATNCTACHGDSVMHLYENNIHPALFDPDYCKACHDYSHYNTGDAFVNQGGTSTNGWSGFGAVPISRRVHGVHFGKYLKHSEEIYANADYFKDVIFPQDVRNCTKCHDGNPAWTEEAARVPCLACHDSDEAKYHAALMTFDLTPDDPYGGDEVETCIICHGEHSAFSPDQMHNISDPYKPPYPREPAGE